MSSLFRKINLKNVIGLSLISFGVVASIVYAVNTPNFILTINPGTLAVDIVDVDDDYASIDSPVFNFNSVNSSVECLTGANAPIMVLGDAVIGAKYASGGYIYVSNPDASSDGFTVSLAASNGNTAKWTNTLEPATQFDFNTIDCANGRMYVDPSVATIANGKCSVNGCTTAGVSLGTSSNFDYGVVDSITLVQADSFADNIADYVINGINVSQTIPAFVSSGDYSLDMTMSVISSGNNEGVITTGPVVTYNRIDIFDGDHIYTAASNGGWFGSSDVLTVWGSNLSNNVEDFRGITSYSGHYWVWYGSSGYYTLVSSSIEQQSVYLSAEDVYTDLSDASPVDITYTATGSNGVTTTFTVHYGTGILCSDSTTWVGSIENCPI